MTMEKGLPRIGVVGQGAFGAFVLKALPVGCEYRTYDPKQSKGEHATSFNEIFDVDILIPAIPLFSYNDFFSAAKDKINPQTLVVDVCSVKTTPQQLLGKYLPDHPNILMTHPLFGPQSAGDTFEGHTLIVTGYRGDKALSVIDYCKNNLQLRVMEMTPEEHDKTMAQVHVLTFFAARGLGAMNLPEVAFMTPSYREVLDLVALDRTHTEELFRTIQLGNPYVSEMRKKYIDALAKVHKELGDGNG